MRPAKVLGVANPMQFPDDMTDDEIKAILQQKFKADMFNRATGNKSDALTLVQNTAAPYEPTLAEKIGTGIGDTLRDTGIISDNYGAQRIGRNVSALAEFLPGVGDATAGDEFGRAVKQGDKFGMAMAGLGAIPVAGDAAKGVLKKLPDYEELRLFHGTNKKFDKFDVDAEGEFSSSDTGGNISMTPFFDEAESYSRGGKGGTPRVIESDFKGRVKVVEDLDEHDAYEMLEIEDKARGDGYDAVYYSGIQDSAFYNPMGSTDTVKILNPESITQKNKSFTRDDYKKGKFLSFSGKGRYSDDELKDLLKISDDDISRYKAINQSLPMDEVSSVEQLSESIKSKKGIKTLSLYEDRKGNIKLDTIIVDKDGRGSGVGSKAMEDIIKYADKNNKLVKLTPAVKDDFQGTTSQARLRKFYKRFGFVENKGRNKDYAISELMYREPKP